MLLHKESEKDKLHDVIECLTSAMEAKDPYTSGHSSRVADMTYDIALSMGIRDRELEIIHLAAHLHDIGKIGIPEAILNKKGKLLPEEWDLIKKHPEIGYNILSKSKHMGEIAEIVLYHHERWDGKGYPKGLRQDEIPLGSRIITVADSIDAMTYSRPYRTALSWEEYKAEINVNSGVQFDPSVGEAANIASKGWKITELVRPSKNIASMK